MQCEFCEKWVSTEYILKTHKRTAKSCLLIQEQKGVTIKPLPFDCIHCRKDFTSQQRLNTHLSICKSKPTHSTCSLCHDTYVYGQDEKHKATCRYKKEKTKKEHVCVFCHKILTTKQHLTHHLVICKEKKAIELSHVKRDRSQQKQLEQSVKRIEETVEDKIEQLASDIRNTKEELEHELRLKDEEIKQLKQSQLVVHQGKTSQSNTTTCENMSNSTINQAETVNTTNTNNYTTIFQYITPQVIKDAYQDYTIDQIKGGQKEFADVVRKSLINQHGQAGYICTDRARKKCGYINESQEFVEDIQCNQLIQTSLPSIPLILESFKSSSEDEQTESKKGLDDIMSLGKNNTKFVSRLCKTLPSNPHTNDQCIEESISTVVQEAKDDLTEFEEEERHFKMEQEADLARFGYQEPVVRTIGGVRLGALDIYYKRYQRDGVLIVKPELHTLYDEDDTIRREYDDLITKGLYHGERVWTL
jgi:hypothetical protein